MFKERVAIYGLFRFGLCLYVGQTVDPKQRKLAHFSEKRQRFKGACFWILRWASMEESGRIENQLIRAYWRKGQAKYNKEAKRQYRHKYRGPRVRLSWSRRIFPDPAALARYLGGTVGPIWKAIHNGNERHYLVVK